MVRDRKELGKIFRQILGNDNVYFSPPSSKQMKYPCIRYNVAGSEMDHANNSVYRMSLRYEVTYITKSSTSGSNLIEEMLKIPYCRFDRRYYADGLDHYVFTLYY